MVICEVSRIHRCKKKDGYILHKYEKKENQGKFLEEPVDQLFPQTKLICITKERLDNILVKNMRVISLVMGRPWLIVFNVLEKFT